MGVIVHAESGLFHHLDMRASVASDICPIFNCPEDLPSAQSQLYHARDLPHIFRAL